ncbi:MAG: hypothetical protein AB199_01700 [Parcubacteria bacterium C7867-004]|nr:MAG: hypothetical protein AB199_01700 [Parcubacteria bacterium C7867-004]
MKRQAVTPTPKAGQKSASRGFSIWWIVGAVGAFIALIALISVFVFGRSEFMPQTDTYTFARDLSIDNGQKIDPATFKDTTGKITLAEVFTDNKALSYYGADDKGQDGVGLTVRFVTTVGGRPVPGGDKAFSLPGWKSRNENGVNNPVRRAFAKEKQGEFHSLVGSFAASVSLDRLAVVVVDTTSGVSEDMARRVNTTVNGICKDPDTVVRLHLISSESYQGGAREWRCRILSSGEIDAVIASQGANASGVLKSLRAITESVSNEVAENPRSLVTVHVFTDGIENYDGWDFYKAQRPMIEDQSNWSKVDERFGLASFKLQGVRFVLHPTPQPPEHQALMGHALAYLADRLENAGAKVQKLDF